MKPSVLMDIGPSEGLVALVTGGYKNLGKEISRKLKELGYVVVATYRSDEEAAMNTSKELGIEVHKADMSREIDVKKLFSFLRSKGSKVCILVNNISSFPTGPLLDIETEELETAFRTSVFSSIFTTREAVKDMKGIGWGRVVNISMAGTDSVKGYRKVAAHGAAKTALNVLTLSLSNELKGSGITVNAVLPGIIDRIDRDGSWREEMKRMSPNGRLVTDEMVVEKIVTCVNSRELNGELLEVI